MKKDNNEKCAKIIKNLNALGHLITNIKFNYGILCSVYEHKDEIEDIEFKDFECALNNFCTFFVVVFFHLLPLQMIITHNKLFLACFVTIFYSISLFNLFAAVIYDCAISRIFKAFAIYKYHNIGNHTAKH